MLGIARNRSTSPAIRRRQYATADAAIGAGGSGGAQMRIDGGHGSNRVMPPLNGCASERPNIMSARMRSGGLAVADQFEIPERVADIADQDGAGQPPLRYHELLVGAVIDVAEHDRFAAVGADEIARREHADAGDLQIGRDHAAAIEGDFAGEVPRQHTRLLVGRLDQAIADAAMFGAFADRKDVRRAGLQMVIDDDAAVDGNAGFPGERDVRPDAGGEDHRIGIDATAVAQARRLRPASRHGCARCWH